MTDFPIKSPRKLIEVALPLDLINEACAYEKMPGIGAHPRGIHLWWARRPLSAARAIIFAQMVNDPGFQSGAGFRYGKNKKEAAIERERLFRILHDLVRWENRDDTELLERANREIRRSWNEVCDLNKDHPEAHELFEHDRLPSLHDPFAGGGAIPLEAMRLGLPAYASDLNPVPVLINKAMLEIPGRFKDAPSISARLFQGASSEFALDDSMKGSEMFEDLRHYGRWVHQRACEQIGAKYPPARVTEALAESRPDLLPLRGMDLDVIAWLWVRTVKSPNPAFAHVNVPLASSFILSNKPGKEAYVIPRFENGQVAFDVQVGCPPPEAANGTKSGSRGANFICLCSGTPISPEYIRAEGQAGRIGQQLMAVIADSGRSRVYLPPTDAHESTAKGCTPRWVPDLEFFQQALGFRVGNYGMRRWSDLFTSRQLLGLTTLTDLLSDVRIQIIKDALRAGFEDDKRGLEEGGKGASAYAEAIIVYLSFAINRCADFSNTLTRWVPGNQKVMNLFGKQTVSMTWDFPEAALLSKTVGGFLPAVDYIADCLGTLPRGRNGQAFQADAQTQQISRNKIISTDPPYYDNIGYADLSDFFYMWLRRSLRVVYPTLLNTIATPKNEELVATPVRHGNRESAEAFFLDGMTKTMQNLAALAHPEGPITIYYAFKQADTTETDGTSSTGWETFLTALITAGYVIVGTWPLRSEQEVRIRSINSNALASSIVLVCRRRDSRATSTTRREFIRELNKALPEAIDDMTKGINAEASPVAPVDLSQAVIGPGMAVFSKYSQVLEADGSSMTVRTALQLINRFLAEDDFDSDTQWCLRWFEQRGWTDGPFGEADVLARSKSISVSGLTEAGVVISGSGRVRLRKWNEYPDDWDPRRDGRTPVWEILHQLVRSLRQGGEAPTGRLLSFVRRQTEPTRQLAYRLHTLCDRQGWADDARSYNELITSWPAIETASAFHKEDQNELFG